MNRLVKIISITAAAATAAAAVVGTTWGLWRNSAKTHTTVEPSSHPPRREVVEPQIREVVRTVSRIEAPTREDHVLFDAYLTVCSILDKIETVEHEGFSTQVIREEVTRDLVHMQNDDVKRVIDDLIDSEIIQERFGALLHLPEGVEYGLAVIEYPGMLEYPIMVLISDDGELSVFGMADNETFRTSVPAWVEENGIAPHFYLAEILNSFLSSMGIDK